MKLILVSAILLFLMPSLVSAQFTGPVVDREELTVEKAQEAMVGTYATVTGRIINQLREDYYTFQDETGEIRIEVSPALWNNRQVTPQMMVRLSVEVDSNIFGRRYLWVESIEILEESEG
jgi:uncharacterized protein (TIGR00156 family)